MEFKNIKNFSTGGKSLTKIYHSGGVVWKSIPMSDLVTIKKTGKIYKIRNKESMKFLRNLDGYITLYDVEGNELNYDDYVNYCQFDSFVSAGRYNYARYYIYFKDDSVSKLGVQIQYQVTTTGGDVM